MRGGGGAPGDSLEGAYQFTEYRPGAAYHMDRWIVNKVTFYLTFC